MLYQSMPLQLNQAAQRIQDAAAYTFLSLLLTVSVDMLGSKLGAGWLLQLSKCSAAVVAFLELTMVALGTSMVLRAGYYLLKNCRQMRRGEVYILWISLRKAVRLALCMWLLVVAATSLPLVMELPTRVPVSGLVFVPLILVFGQQWLSIGAYRHLAILMDECQKRPATVTFVA